MSEELQTEELKETSQSDKKPRAAKSFLYGVLAVVVLAVAAAGFIGFRATRNLSANPTVVRFAKVLGLSIAKVNDIGVPYADYMEDMGVLKKYYDSQGPGVVPYTEQEVSDQVLSRLIVSALINSYAQQYKVDITDTEVQESPILAQLIAPFGSREAAETEMKARYGLTFDQYVKKVVRPVLLEQKLQEAFAVSTDEAGAAYAEEQVRARHILFPIAYLPETEAGAEPKEDPKVQAEAQAVLERLKKGEDFAALAKEFGTDSTKDVGGDLGWFGRGRMVPEFEQAAFSVEPGVLLPELVKSQFGYHIIRIDEKRNGRDYSKFMGDQLRLAKIEMLISKVHNPFAAPAEGQNLENLDTIEPTQQEESAGDTTQ
jgi:hypothetical protein